MPVSRQHLDSLQLLLPFPEVELLADAATSADLACSQPRTSRSLRCLPALPP